MMHLAIDSKPLNTYIQSTFDYSGIQVLGLFYSNIIELSREVTTSDKRIKILFDDNISANEFKKSIDNIRKNVNCIRSFVFNRIDNIYVDKNMLVLNVDRKFDIESLKIPNLAIRRKDRVKATVTIVDNPETNVLLFDTNKVDCESDTAVFLDNIGTEHKIDWTGLLASFCYSEEFTKRIAFKSIHSIISGFELSSYFDIYPKIYRKVDILKISTKEELKIAYDDFYPNSIIVKELKSYLENFGINITLVKDCYYRPHVSYDVKFMITRPLGNSNTYYWLWALSQTNNLSLQKKIISNIDRNSKFDFSYLVHEGISVPLFKLMSIYRSRLKENPLLSLMKGIFKDVD